MTEKTRLSLQPTPLKVAILGNLNIDLIIRGIVRMPQWGQEVIGDSYALVSSGQSAYTGFALARYGVPVTLIGNVGDDLYGEKILHDLDAAGVGTQDIERIPHSSTGISVAVVRPDGERAFISDTACLSKFGKALIKRHLDSIRDAALACLVGLFFVPGLSVRDAGQVFQQIRRMGKPVLLDTGWDANNWPKQTVSALRRTLKHVDLFIPNLDEARAITGRDDPELAARELRNDGVGTVVIKLGADGSLCLSKEGMIRLRVRPTRVIDAVGAGDVFNAGFIYGSLLSLPLEARMVLGTVTSSLYISRSSDRFPTLPEVIRAANAWKGNRFSFQWH